MKIVYRAADITEAEIVKGMLVANGIDAHVSGYYLQGGIGEVGAIDLAKVHVSDEEYDRARELVAEYEGGRDTQKPRAPELETLDASRFRKVLVTVVLIVLVSILGYWLWF